MHITRIIFTFLAALLCGMVQAQDESVVLQVELNNGDVVEGALSTSGHFKYPFCQNESTEVTVLDKESGKKQTFASTDVKEVRVYNEEDSTWVKWVPMIAQKIFPTPLRKTPKVLKSPIFFHPIYEGKHVSAYVRFSASSVNFAANMWSHNTWVFYYYKVHNEDIAMAYTCASDGNIEITVEGTLKRVFKDRPEMTEIVENTTKAEMCEDPTSIIKKFDAVLDVSSFKAE